MVALRWRWPLRALRPAPEGEDEAANRPGVTVVPGVVVTEVMPGSPAAAARLAPGDVITGVNAAAVLSGPELRAATAPLEEGAEVRLRVTRAGKERELKARLDG